MYGWRTERGLGDATGPSEFVLTWCLDFPWFCSAETVQAAKNANAVLQGDTVLPSQLTPPTLAKGATAPLTPANPVSTLPTGCQDDPSMCVQAQVTAQTQQNQNAMQQFFANLDPTLNPPGPGCTSSILPSFGVCDSTIYWTAGILAGVFALSAFMKGGR